MAHRPRKYHIGIVGSRQFKDYTLLCAVLHRVFKWTDRPCCQLCIVSGGAPGVDSLAALYAGEHMIEPKIILPQWLALGKGAGYIRNAQIVKESDLIVAFWDGVSTGTQCMIDHARKAGKETFIHYVN